MISKIAPRLQPLRRYLRLILRPWKLISFLLGTAFFIWGAYFWAVPTWDVGVSILMSVLCYALAPWAVPTTIHALRTRGEHWQRRAALGSAVVYFIASGSYEIYNTIRMGQHPVTYWYNLWYSVPVTIIAGVIWSYDGSIADFVRQLRGAVRATRA